MEGLGPGRHTMIVEATRPVFLPPSSPLARAIPAGMPDDIAAMPQTTLARAVPLTNPSMRFDLKASMVVIEFFDADGQIQRKIPSERVLEAYARGQDPGFPAVALVVDAEG
jgi:hypothetical protein